MTLAHMHQLMHWLTVLKAHYYITTVHCKMFMAEIFRTSLSKWGEEMFANEMS